MANKTRGIHFGGMIPYLIGMLITVIVALILAGTAAAFILNEYIDIKLCDYIAAVVLFLAVFAGELLTVKLSPSRRVFTMLIVPISIVILMACCALLFFDGISGNAFGCCMGAAAGALAAIFVDKAGNKKHKRTRYRSRSR